MTTIGNGLSASQWLPLDLVCIVLTFSSLYLLSYILPTEPSSRQNAQNGWSHVLNIVNAKGNVVIVAWILENSRPCFGYMINCRIVTFSKNKQQNRGIRVQIFPVILRNTFLMNESCKHKPSQLFNEIVQPRALTNFIAVNKMSVLMLHINN